MSEFYKYPCGCQFEIIGPPTKKFKQPKLKINWYEIPLNCTAAWELLQSGNTQGIFQLETSLGKTWAGKIKPETIEHMGAIGAVLRPGVLRSMSEGKSLTAHYSDRKNGKDEIKPYHPVYDECVKETYGILVYQEQAIAICMAVANFTEAEGDNLRKAAGKKIAAEMAKMKQLFMFKSKEAGIVSEQQAEEIFSWIENSQRYSFNACLSPDTIVETEQEFKTLEQISIGEKIKSPDGFVEVINKYDNGLKDVYEISLESGKSISCTLDHKFLCEDGKILPLSKIIEKDLKIICEDD